MGEREDGSREEESLYGLLLIDFDHSRGPLVSMSWPPELQHMVGLEDIAFYALPDRIHEQDEDVAAFHLCVQRPGTDKFETVYGLSAIRRIDTADLIDKPENVTRNTIQKAVVVLSRRLLFGRILAKLKVATAAFFRQLSFEDSSILGDLRLDLASAIENNDEQGITAPGSVRALIKKYRTNVLVLVKALVLQRSILFYGAPPVERIVSQQYALLSLIPGELDTLENSASPLLPVQSDQEEANSARKRPNSLQQSNRKSLQRYLGLPLGLFERERMFSPILPLQHVDILDGSASYLVGTTNTLIAHRRDCIKVNVDAGIVELGDLPASHLLAPSAADRKWMDKLCKTVMEADASNVHFVGSDDWIVFQFEEYMYSFLAAVKEAEHLAKQGYSTNSTVPGGLTKDNLGDFGKEWVSAWLRTEIAQLWSARVESDIFGICPPQHPVSGRPSIIEDFGLRINEHLQHLHVTENLAYAKDNISSFIAAQSTSLRHLYGAADNWRRGARVKQQGDDATTDHPVDPSGPPDTIAASTSQDNLSARASNAFAGIGSFFSRRRMQSAGGDTISSISSVDSPSRRDRQPTLGDRELTTISNSGSPYRAKEPSQSLQGPSQSGGIRPLKLQQQTPPQSRSHKTSESISNLSSVSDIQGGLTSNGPKPLLLSTQASPISANPGRRSARRISGQLTLSETASSDNGSNAES